MTESSEDTGYALWRQAIAVNIKVLKWVAWFQQLTQSLTVWYPNPSVVQP